ALANKSPRFTSSPTSRRQKTHQERGSRGTQGPPCVGGIREPREGLAGRQNRTTSAQLSDRLDRGRAYAHGDRVEFRFQATAGAAEEVAAGLAGNAARTQVRA